MHAGLVTRSPGYLFNCHAGCEVDAWEFEKYRQSARAAKEREELGAAIEEHQAGLRLLEGEFLSEEPYEEWAMQAREEWRECHLSVLSELAECLALRGRYTEAVEVCDRALGLDRFVEELNRRLVLYYYCAGEQGQALRAFRDYARMLEEELGIVPSPDFIRLKEQIQARDVPGVDALRRYPRPRRPMKFPYSLGRMYLAGRDREYALLVERLREASGGMGSAVAVEGEAGVGKTRLVEELLGYARSRRVKVLSGRCYERELGPPLEPIMEAMGSPADDGLELPASEPRGTPGYEWRDGLREDSARVYRALTRKLTGEFQDEGYESLVLFVDDVQWADPATLNFLLYFAKRIVGERVLLIFTYRREQASGLSGWLESLAERRVASTLTLERLSSEDLGKILIHMSSRSFGELSVLASFLHQESEGNPFYAVEYLRWLIEAGAVEVDSRRRVSGLRGEALREKVLPSGVRALIRARFSSLTGEDRRLLELESVVGRSFDLGLLCRATGHDEAGISGIVEPMISSGMIFETREGRYYFSHDKLR